MILRIHNCDSINIKELVLVYNQGSQKKWKKKKKTGQNPWFFHWFFHKVTGSLRFCEITEILILILICFQLNGISDSLYFGIFKKKIETHDSLKIQITTQH